MPHALARVGKKDSTNKASPTNAATRLSLLRVFDMEDPLTEIVSDESAVIVNMAI
jgi:hypothetical protein